MAGVLPTSPTSMKAENFNLLYILGIPIRFSKQYSASKNKSENIKPVYYIPDSQPPDQVLASWSLRLHSESIEAVCDGEVPWRPRLSQGLLSLPFSQAVRAGTMR